MLFLSTIAALALSNAVAFGSPLPATPEDQAACAAVHIFSARGSNQPAGSGPTLAPVVEALLKAYAGATHEPIDWAARIFPYDTNSHQGTLAVTKQLTAYVGKCPDSKIVMVGYSQGAHIIGDSLCGGGDSIGLGPAVSPIARSIGDHVTAVVWLGDPRHVGNAPYNKGTSTRNGLFPRVQQSQSCNYYSAKIQSFCDTGDFFCDGGLEMGVHGQYIPKYQQAALDFISARLA